MPYKDPAKKRQNDKRRNERFKQRRKEDPEFAKKEKDARSKWYKEKYASDPIYKRQRNAKRVVAKYGLSTKDYVELLNKQGYACAICRTPHFDENGKRLCIDHNHTLGTTAVRGLLCNSCNMGLGLFKDSVEILANAKKYLEMSV